MSMNKKGKVLALSLLAVLMVSFMAGGVFGASLWENLFGKPTAGDKIGDFLRSVIDGIQKGGEPVFGALLGETTGGDLFTKVLLFLLVVFVIVAVLDVVPFFTGKSWLIWLSAIVIAVFGIRFIPAGLIQTITLPSSALALIIGLGFPFLIFFYIIHRIDNIVIRKAGWIVFGAIILFLWFYNWNNAALDKFRWIYLVAVIACILAFWFDGTLQRWLRKAKSARSLEKIKSVEINRAKARIADLQTALGRADNILARKEIKNQIETQEDNLKELSRF